MEKLTLVSGRAYPFGMRNVDTDIIVPARWLKLIDRKGLAEAAFEPLRQMPGNVFDDPAYNGAPILIAGDNFGCGSSREHAAWALQQLGVRVVLAPGYSEIFASNAYKNGILAAVVPQEAIDALMDLATEHELTIDLAAQEVRCANMTFAFAIDPYRKETLMAGLDEIGQTEAFTDLIDCYERAAAASPSLVPDWPDT